MDTKLRLVPIPVSDVDRGKAFHAEKVGFDVDLDVNTDARVVGEMRVVQLTPPGSACSISIGTGIVDTPPGSVRSLHLVVLDIEAARAKLVGRGGGRRGPTSRRHPLRLLRRPRRQRLGPATASLLAFRSGVARALMPGKAGPRSTSDAPPCHERERGTGMGKVGTGFSTPSGGIIPGVSPQSAGLLRKSHESVGALVVGREHFAHAGGCGGRHPVVAPVLVVTHHRFHVVK